MTRRAQKQQRSIRNRREALRRQAQYLEAKLSVQMAVASTATPVSTTVDAKPAEPYKRPVLDGLTRKQSKILRRLADGWHIGVGRGLNLVRNARIGAKVRVCDVLALVKQGLLTAGLLLSSSARALLWAIQQNDGGKAALFRAAAKIA